MIKNNEVIYWDQVYSSNSLPKNPSLFALWASAYIDQNMSILDVGCGNGRDTTYFGKIAKMAIGIDRSHSAIEANKKSNEFNNVEFLQCDVAYCADVAAIMQKYLVSAVYSRFFLHSISEDVCDNLLMVFDNELNKGGYIFFEYRTDRDPLMNLGAVISDSERLTDHYRRFINHSQLIKKILDLHWSIIYEEENFGLAPYKDEDPCVGRLVLRK